MQKSKKIKMIGVDLAKNVYQVHATDSRGRQIFNKAMSPEKFMIWMANVPSCLVGMEACGGSHHVEA